MGLIELFFIAVGLSMDAFAVSICKGLACREQNLRHNLLAGLYFGGFQGLMPAIGWLLGVPVFGCHHQHRPLDRLCAALLHRRQHDPGVPQ